MASKINNLLLASAVLGVLLTPLASAQSTLTWIGNQTNSANVSGANNWLGGAAPANDTDYDFVFDAANLVPPGTSVPRTSATWNRAVGVLSLSFAGNVTYPSFTFSATSASMMTLKGGITVTSGGHRLDNPLTVGTDAEWNIAAGSSLTRAGKVDTLTMAADRKITKTGAGTLVLQQANANMLGTLEVQQGVLQVRTVENALGGATLALNGGTLEIFSNNTRTNNNATTTVIGESMVRSAREAEGAGLSHVMGALQLGSSTLTVTANELNTSGTVDVTFGNTTLSNDATLEVVNNIAGATTRLTLGAVGETGGARGLTKTGNGQLLLNANNTYSGATVVSAGSLTIGAGGSVGNSSVFDVASGATLDVSAVTGGFAVGASQTLRGSGTILGNTTINGALQPGNSPGLLTFNNDLTLGSTAVTTMEINSAATRGTTFDAVNVVGLLTYGGNLTLSMGTTFGVGSYSFDLFEFGSTAGSFDTVTLGDLYSGSLVNSSGVWGLANGHDTWTFTQSSGLLELEVVPEPSTYALLVLAAAGLGARVIRRRRR